MVAGRHDKVPNLTFRSDVTSGPAPIGQEAAEAIAPRGAGSGPRPGGANHASGGGGTEKAAGYCPAASMV